MGLNAQTSVPAFTAGQILTAQQQTEINTGIPVFATTTTRDAAFGGTGEKTLAEGQFAYIEATNTTQYYDGSAWQVVGASGLVYLTGGSFSSVSSISLPNNTFTATYRNYLLNINLTANSSDSNPLWWRGRTSGSDNSTSNYFYGLRGTRFSDGAATSGGSGTSQTVGMLTRLQNPFTTGSVTATFFGPQLASNTTYVVQATGRGNGDPDAVLEGGGYFATSTQFDALSIIPNVGTISGTYEVYGYAIS